MDRLGKTFSLEPTTDVRDTHKAMMKKFRFRLEAVERVRHAKEQEALRGLALAQAKYHETLAVKRRLLEENEQALVRREALAKFRQPVLAYQIESEFIHGNRQRFAQADQAIFRARKFVEKALREVILAKRSLRAIELLREKDYAEFKIATRKLEQKALEEVYASRFLAGDDSESEWSEIA